MAPRHRKHTSAANVLTLVALTLIVAAASSPSGQVPSKLEPAVIRAGNASVGLIYSVELLAALAARQPAGTVSTRITEAVRDRTPIVVMWTFPPNGNLDPAPPRPYRIAIVERHEWASSGNLNRIEPLWSQQNASGLAELDRRVRSQEVGVMAAFRPEAFVPGRRIGIYSETPMNDGSGGMTGSNRHGFIEWQPVRDRAR